MSKHTKQRVNDQYHCSCGLQWDIDEADPHILNGVIKMKKEMEKTDIPLHDNRKVSREAAKRALIQIKENLNRE